MGKDVKERVNHNLQSILAGAQPADDAVVEAHHHAAPFFIQLAHLGPQSNGGTRREQVGGHNGATPVLQQLQLS